MFPRSYELIDISVPLSPATPVWPGDPVVELRPLERIAEGDAANVTQMVCSTHCGTHVDPPLHFVAGATPVDRVPVDRWVGPCQVVHLPDGVVRIEPSHLDAAGIRPETTRLLLRTTNSAKWQAGSPTFDPDYAALTPAAARWVVERGIELVGIDYLSIECFDDSANETHRTLLGNDVVVIEGLRLDAVAPGAYFLLCLPLKIADGDGAPARVVLMADRNDDGR
jgi:arylformamidase